MTDQRLFLHIGTHKTGTTSFQESLRANAEKLARRGYYAFGQPNKKRGFFRKRRIRYNASNLTQVFLRPGIGSIARFRAGNLEPNPANMAKLRANFLRQLQAVKSPNLVVSGEGFTFLRTPAEKADLRAFLAELGREVTIVLVLRDEAGWRASWENQLRKLPKVWASTQALPQDRRANGEWYYDRQSILDFWVGLGELRTVNYNLELESEGNVIPAIYRAMGVDLNGLKLSFKANKRVVLDDEDDDEA